MPLVWKRYHITYNQPLVESAPTMLDDFISAILNNPVNLPVQLQQVQYERQSLFRKTAAIGFSKNQFIKRKLSVHSLSGTHCLRLAAWSSSFHLSALNSTL